MALPSLATATDLDARGVDVANAARVQAALDAASAAVREAAGCAISAQTSTIEVVGGPGQWLDLGVSPVAAVSAVSLNGSAVTDYTVTPQGLWRECGWRSGAALPVVTVTVTHGLAEVPADIVELVCNLAAASLAQAPGSRVGVANEAIDDYRVGFAEQSSVMELPERTAAWLRSRFGRSAETTGTR